MSRYIDADKLQEAFKELHGGKRSLLIDTEPTADVVEADKAQKEIDYWHDKAQSYEQTILKLSLNKADAVDVVRCEDCKHYVLHTLFGRTQGWCERLCDKFDKSLAHGTEGDDFCSKERKKQGRCFIAKLQGHVNILKRENKIMTFLLVLLIILLVIGVVCSWM